MTGIEELRRAVNLFGNTREDFNTDYTAEELIKIYRAYKASGWDITPDEWTQKQVDHALRKGRAPSWDDNGNPTYS